MGFDIAYMVEALPQLLRYLPTTLVLAVSSMVIGMVIALALALCRYARIPVLNQLAVAYVSFFRGVPTLVQLFLVYYGLPQLIPEMSTLDALTAAVMGLSLKEASYLTEIFRAGLSSVNRGQYEAGLASGMSRSKVYARYIIPQAAWNALPATGNVFVSLIKETSIVFTLGITEMFASAQMVAADNFHYFETYLVVGLLYWGVVVIVGVFLSIAEKRLSRPYQR